MDLSETNRSSGFTLLETVTSASILVVLLGVAYSIIARSGKTAGAGMAVANADEQVRTVLERAARELLGASSATFDPPSPRGADSLLFRVVSGFSSGVPTFGDLRSIRLVEDESDPNDGVDNDSDGIVDERVLLYVRNVGEPNEYSVVWARGVPELAPDELENGADDNGNGLVDEAGFSVELDGRTMTLRLALERPTVDGGRYVQEIETSVFIRN